MRRQLVWALLLVVASFGLASAQETTSGSLAGTVIDAQGAPVPGATVTLSSAEGPKTFVTDTNGRFFAPFLTPGQVYAVTAYLLHLNGIVDANSVMDAAALAKVQMPNREGFRPDPRPDTSNAACTRDCR